MKYILPIILLLHCQQLIAGSTDEAVNSNTQNDATPLTRVRRGGLSMLRLGRGLQMLRLGKRSMPMLRMGRSSSNLNSDDMMFLLNALQDKYEHPYRRDLLETERQAPLPRYGRDEEDEYPSTETELRALLQEALLQREQRPFALIDDESPRHIRLAPRPGRYRRSLPDEKTDDSNDSQDDVDAIKENEVKSLPLPRFGRMEDEEDKYDWIRALPIPRFGRDEEELAELGYTMVPVKLPTEDKRAMHMLRLGRGMHMLRLGKRAMNMLRLGRSEIPQEGSEADEKRSLSMLRLGKRLHMLRLGKRFESDDGKRSLRMMRLGKKDDDSQADSDHVVNTRAMHMLRLGRNA